MKEDFNNEGSGMAKNIPGRGNPVFNKTQR